MKTILVYCWNSFTEKQAMRAMEEIGYHVVSVAGTMKDCHADAEIAKKIMFSIHSENVDMVFSYDFFPLISMICEMNHIPYVAWIYDCPQNMLLSKTIKNNYNHIFCFDEIYAKRLMNLGAQNVYHFPLAADLDMYERVQKGEEEECYVCDISFVGGLYNGERNRLLKANLSEYSEGYVDALLYAQKEICGYNLIAGALSKEVAEEIVNKCELVLSEHYITNTVQMAADAINMKLTAWDREETLLCLAQNFDVTLYTNSELTEQLLCCPRLFCKGTVGYRTEMPLVFHNSKINLNITSRTIESGVSQRVFDILACGGFCLTNYQPEIADLFEDGKELVMYTDMEDMVQKARYYLENEEERRQIAQAGYEKVCNCFGVKDRILELINYII